MSDSKNNLLGLLVFIAVIISMVVNAGCSRAGADSDGGGTSPGPTPTPTPTPTPNDTAILLIQVSDLHGNLVPHAGIIETDTGQYNVTQGGGIAKVATVVNDLRSQFLHNLVLGVGDSIHGGAEVLFTMGDAMMPAWNALGLDAYTPGNWEFAYGPAVFRARFTELCKANPAWQNPPQVNPQCPPIVGNVSVMVNSDGVPGVTVANFPTLAANLYNGGPYPRGAPFYGKRPLAPYKIFQRNGTMIAVIGLTASIVPQQAPVFSRTFTFTQGTEELQGLIDQAKLEGAELIVVQSELGLPQNVQIGREFKDVDVILSAHSHELTLGAILADADGVEMVTGIPTASQVSRLLNGAAIVVESGEDLYVGALALHLINGKINSFNWQAVPVDDAVVEDPTIKALVDEQERFFIAGPDFKSHTFLPAAYCTPTSPCVPDAQGIVYKGLRLVESLDTVVGKTEVLLNRHESLEGTMNNFIADAVRDSMQAIVAVTPGRDWGGLDVISMTNGFRFDTVVLPADQVPAGSTFRDGRQPGDITLRDLWSYFPIAPALVAADFSGSAIESSLSDVLDVVFNPNPFLQRGGWYMGISSNMSQKVDVVNLPKSSSTSRIVETRVGGALIDHSKRYVLVSCYGHTFPLGRVCRTDGGANAVYFSLADGDDYSSTILYSEPLPLPGPIIDNKTAGTPIYRVAPDNYLHAVHLIRRTLDGLVDNTITAAQYGVGRVQHVDVTTATLQPQPLPASGLPGIIQPIEGSGPSFLDRVVNWLTGDS